MNIESKIDKIDIIGYPSFRQNNKTTNIILLQVGDTILVLKDTKARKQFLNQIYLPFRDTEKLIPVNRLQRVQLGLEKLSSKKLVFRCKVKKDTYYVYSVVSSVYSELDPDTLVKDAKRTLSKYKMECRTEVFFRLSNSIIYKISLKEHKYSKGFLLRVGTIGNVGITIHPFVNVGIYMVLGPKINVGTHRGRIELIKNKLSTIISNINTVLSRLEVQVDKSNRPLLSEDYDNILHDILQKYSNRIRKKIISDPMAIEDTLLSIILRLSRLYYDDTISNNIKFKLLIEGSKLLNRGDIIEGKDN